MIKNKNKKKQTAIINNFVQFFSNFGQEVHITSASSSCNLFRDVHDDDPATGLHQWIATSFHFYHFHVSQEHR